MSENGDVRKKLSFTVAADSDRLDFVSFHEGVNWDWPEKHRDGVKIEVRTPEIRGVGGTRLDVTHQWVRRNTVMTYVHLDEPIVRDDEFTFVVDIFWPAMCLPFVRGKRSDSFLASFAETAGVVEFRIVLPKRWVVRFDHLGLTPSRDDYVLTASVDREGRTVASLVVRDLPGYRKVGLKLDLPSVAA
ncbi:hypothetical protein ACFXGA_03495 [Actinosynnema sp. NPDC059335]|uniref:hypothetical protein n=1 Tax=Actinosynnema sp. NPDC059335 TaxID=3346804 RepID=UPI00366E126D